VSRARRIEGKTRREYKTTRKSQPGQRKRTEAGTALQTVAAKGDVDREERGD